MIAIEDIENAISKANKYSVLSVDQETSFYKIGAIKRGKYIRCKITYLEFYSFALTELLLFYDAGLDPNDYDITDDQIQLYIDQIDELITVLFLQE